MSGIISRTPSTATPRRKFGRVCGGSLGRLWMITLRKQLAKVLNGKTSKQPGGSSKPAEECLRGKISFVFREKEFANEQS